MLRTYGSAARVPAFAARKALARSRVLVGNSPSGSPAAVGGPPGGPGKPSESALQTFLNGAFDVLFNLLYISEPQLKLDSSKNLRVLWVRALLASAGQLDDDVAYELLPRSTRWLVSPTLAPLWQATPAQKLPSLPPTST